MTEKRDSQGKEGTGRRHVMTYDPQANKRFKDVTTTATASIVAAQVGEPQAEERLCRRWWPAVRYLFEKKGVSRDEAEDLAQDFFDVLLRPRGKGKITRYIRYRQGRRRRFRWWLTTVIRHATIDYWRRRAARIREQGGQITSFEHLQDDCPDVIPCLNVPPEANLVHEEEVLRCCDYVGLHRLALADVATYCAEDNACPFRFEMFRMFYLSREPSTWVEIGKRFGLDRDQARNRVLVALGWYRDILLDETEAEVTPAEAESELKEIADMLGRTRDERAASAVELEASALTGGDASADLATQGARLLPAVLGQGDELAEFEGLAVLPKWIIVSHLERKLRRLGLTWEDVPALVGEQRETVDQWRQDLTPSQDTKRRLAVLLLVLSLSSRKRLKTLNLDIASSLGATLRNVAPEVGASIMQELAHTLEQRSGAREAPQVLHYLTAPAAMTPRELWLAAIRHWQSLGLKWSNSVASALLNVSEDSVEQWRIQGEPGEEVRRRLAALCELLRAVATGRLNAMGRGDLHEVVAALRGLPALADDTTVDDVLSLLGLQFGKAPDDLAV